MHLKSLTLKGFKSFASATTLRLEPGITCVVGPNGSGKSNVVDAISWVLGEQGAKALRGGKMEDVIFAGTSGRAPLGRAEVTLTIDNADGALPIDYAEVSITRRMFRDGAGEYEINGSHCRLLDIQELLSDSGIGREMHVIVGQGQLDSVLPSKPEDRRAYIEEAAGVLKHRKRKEKALRKLDAMQANLTRLTDLTAELRRQLKPLGRQAEIARRAQAVQSELRDARLRLAADDLVTLRDELAREEADEAGARARRAGGGGAALGGPRRAGAAGGRPGRGRAAARRGAGHLVPALRAGRAAARAPSGSPRSGRGTSRTRRRPAHPAATRTSSTPRPTRSPSRRTELVAAVVEARRQLAEVTEARTEHERTLAAAERAHLAAVRALADRRAGLATLAGRAEALRSGAAATAEEIERLSEALAEAHERTAAARGGAARRPRASRGRRRGRDASLDGAAAGGRRPRTRPRAARVAELVAAEREAEQQRAHWRARVEALSVGLARRDGSGALLGAAPTACWARVSGWSRSTPRPAPPSPPRSGELADGRRGRIDLDAAVGRPRHLRAADAGRASLLVAAPAAVGHAPDRLTPSGQRPDRAPGAPVWAPDGSVRRRCRGAVGGRPASTAGPPRWPRRRCGPVRRSCVVDDLDGGARGRRGRAHRRHRRRRPARSAPGVRRVRGRGERAGRAGGGRRRRGRAAKPWRTSWPGCGLRSTAPAPRRRRARPTSRRPKRRAGRRRAAPRGAPRPSWAGWSRPCGRPRPRPSGCGRGATRSRPGGPTRCSRWRPPSGSSRWPRTSRWTTSPTPRCATPPPKPSSRARSDGGRRPAGAAHRRGAGPGDRGPGRLAASPGRRRTPGPGRAAAAARAARERGARIAALVVTAGETACAADRRVAGAAAAERDAAAAARDRAGACARPRRARSTARLTALLEKLTDAVHRDEVLRAQNAACGWSSSPRRCSPTTASAATTWSTEYGPDVPVPAVGRGDGGVRGGAGAGRGRHAAAADALRPRHPAAPCAARRRRTSRCWAR